MKTPDEILYGLEGCANQYCDKDCPYIEDCRREDTLCCISLLQDAAERIRELEQQNAELATRLEQLKRERDAAVKDLQLKSFGCYGCKHFMTAHGKICALPIEKRKPSFECWEWRGVPPKQCETCTNNGWDMPQCKECNAENGYKWYREWAEHE